jgi:DNA-binding transcriptional ArsR family regulator
MADVDATASGEHPDSSGGGGMCHQHPVDPQRVQIARERLPSAEEGDRLTGVLSLMADPTRARLLYALDVVEELCVGDLALALSVSEDAVSYGLRVLRTAGLVTRRKDGRVVYYRLAEGFPEPLREHCLRQLIEMSRAPVDDEA